MNDDHDFETQCAAVQLAVERLVDGLIEDGKPVGLPLMQAIVRAANRRLREIHGAAAIEVVVEERQPMSAVRSEAVH